MSTDLQNAVHMSADSQNAVTMSTDSLIHIRGNNVYILKYKCFRLHTLMTKLLSSSRSFNLDFLTEFMLHIVMAGNGRARNSSFTDVWTG